VCVIEETYFLNPPARVTNPPRPRSTALFRRYVASSPIGRWPENTSTYQGFYLMSPKGGDLGGIFGIAKKEKAEALMLAALDKSKKSGATMRPVPNDGLAIYGGAEPRPGAVKLQLAYRDLPRGNVQRITSAYVRNPYNLGWFDLSAAEALSFRTDSRKPVAIPQRLFRKLATQALKDAVRGQMRGWDAAALTGGALCTQLFSRENNTRNYRLTGSAILNDGSRSYAPQLHGRAVYDETAKKFVEFELVAVGQRTGKGPANGRENDLGPAPIGVAFKLFPVATR
jgi:hypothetical protein